MKKRTVFLTALALTLCLTAGIGSAWAYFTTYAKAEGGLTVNLGSRTEIEEEPPTDWTKHVWIKSNEDSNQAVWVRARAYYPGPYTLAYSGTGWTPGDEGWWYYGGTLEPGMKTEELQVKINGVPEKEEGNLKDGENFNVVVVYECIPVEYEEDGSVKNWAPDDWKKAIEIEGTEGGGN